MKKKFSFILATIIFICMFCLNSFAIEQEQIQSDLNEFLISTNTTYFDDGSYCVETIYQVISPSTYASSYTVSGNKTYTYYDSDQIEQLR